MSTPILPFAVWSSGTNQNSIPANDNSLRNQILNGLIISESTDAQPGSPSDGDIYIMTGAASGAQWATFDEFDADHDGRISIGEAEDDEGLSSGFSNIDANDDGFVSAVEYRLAMKGMLPQQDDGSDED